MTARPALSALALALAAAAANCDGQGPESTVVVAVVVTPSSPTLIGLGVTLQLVAEARNDRGHAIADVPVAWASVDSSIARVSTTGLVTAVLAGTATITATAGEVVGQASVRVRMFSNWLAMVSGSGQAATQHYQLNDSLVVRALDQDGVAIPGIPVTFAVPAGGGQMTCHTCVECQGLAAAQVTTRTDGTATLGVSGGRFSGCTPHSSGRVVLQATSPGFEPATFTFDVVAGGQQFDGVYWYQPWWSYNPSFAVRGGELGGGGAVESDGATHFDRRATIECLDEMRGYVRIDSLGQATVSGMYVRRCGLNGVPGDSVPWAAWRH